MENLILRLEKLSDLWDVSTKALLEKTDASMIPSDDEIKKAFNDSRLSECSCRWQYRHLKRSVR